MTYTILPNSGQSLGVTRAPINTNFSLIQSVFDVNHVGFNNVGAGKHKFVVMPNQGSAPTTLAGEVALYTKQGSAGVGTSALYMIRDGNAGTEVQLSTSAVGNAIAGNTGYTWLPGGLFLQWGQVAAPGSSGTVIFLTPFDVTPYNIQLTLGRSNSSSTQAVYINTALTLNNTQFNYTITTNDSITLYWMAIGQKV